MSDPAVLEPNPLDCAAFEANAFRRDICRNCRLPWRQHAGVIPDDVVQSFLEAERGASEGRAAAAKAKAKAQAKARSGYRPVRGRDSQDRWLFDSAVQNSPSVSGDSDSDGAGFRMFAGDDLRQIRAFNRADQRTHLPSAAPTIRNLVNFAECDVPIPGTGRARDAIAGGASGSSSSAFGPAAPRMPASAVGARAGAGASRADALGSADVGSGAGARPASIGAGSRPAPFALPPPRPPIWSPPPLVVLPAAGNGVSKAAAAALRPAPVVYMLGSVPGGGAVPGRSPDDVLEEEVQYLRQMLADSSEEKKIHVAMIREEMQRTVELLSKQGDRDQAPAAGHELVERLLKDKRQELEQRRSQLEQQQAQLDRREEQERQVQTLLHEREREFRTWSEDCDRKLLDFESTANAQGVLVQQLTDANQVLNAEVTRLQRKLAWWEAKDDYLQNCEIESELSEWESKLREKVLVGVKKLTDRRVELQVAIQSPAPADDRAACKICYDRPSSCALLPCRHHAFCSPCAARVEGTAGAVCPICRTSVTGVFETA
mmetsp:Transcript_47364/g.144073  ORF Transcript_47364/g.144073 Transcript_47364/m.144073 type:complete len:545 (-) Transcript_47364:88-1722(-)